MFGAKQAALGRGGDQLRQAPTVDQPLFLPAIPAIPNRPRQQGAQFPREPGQVDPHRGDPRIESLPVFLQQFGAHQRRGGLFPVVLACEHPVTVSGVFQHSAAAGYGSGETGRRVAFGIHQQREGGVVVVVALRAGLPQFGAAVAQHLAHRVRDRQRKHRIGRLVMARTAQAGQGSAEQRPHGRPGGLEQVFGLFHHRFAKHPRAAHLHHGVQQDAVCAVRQAGMVVGQGPGLERMPQIATDTGQHVGYQRLGPVLLQQFEHHALHRVGRTELRMQERVTAG